MCVNTFAPRNSGRPAGSSISHGEMHFSNTNAWQMQSKRDSLEILFAKGYCGSGDKYAAGSIVNCTLCKAGFLSEAGINREELREMSQASVQKPAVAKIEDTLRIREAILEEAVDWVKFQLWDPMWFDFGFIFEVSLSIYFLFSFPLQSWVVLLAHVRPCNSREQGAVFGIDQTWLQWLAGSKRSAHQLVSWWGQRSEAPFTVKSSPLSKAEQPSGWSFTSNFGRINWLCHTGRPGHLSQ